MKSSILFALGLASASALACASAGTQPHAMSSAEHQSASLQESQTAEAHQAQFDPAAGTTKKCGIKGERGFCWKSEENPTAEHEREAAHHRELAAQHRAAGQSLSAAEAQSCSGLSEDDRDLSPFAHREEILNQSRDTFRRIRPGARLGLYMGQQRDLDADVLFASIQTLGRAEPHQTRRRPRPPHQQPQSPRHPDPLVRP